MEQDFTDRVQDYQCIYNVGIRQTEAPGLYKYYSTQRPVDIGTFPRPPYNKPDEIFNYDQRIPVENGSFLAWGYLTYTRPLTEKQASDYELRPAPDNPDRPRPIAEQMKNAAKLAEADRGSEAPAPPSVGSLTVAIDKEVRIWKKREQELSVLEVLRLHREFHLPHPVPADEQEKPLDKVKEPPRACRSREREER